MTIEETIKETANSEQFANMSYVFEDWYGADAALSRTTLPAIIAILPISGTVHFQNGRVYDTVDIAIAFVDKVARDADGEDNASVYNRMKAVGVDFIKALNDSGNFLMMEDTLNYQVLCEQLSDIVTGVMFTLRLHGNGRCCI